MSDKDIFSLNKECLFRIYASLNLKDQINLTRSSVRFEIVFQEFSQFYYKTIQCVRGLSAEDRQYFACLVGESIEECHDENILNHVIQAAPLNACLKRINFEWDCKNLSYIQNLKMFQKLEEIKIFIDRYAKNEAYHFLLSNLAELPHLRQLHLYPDFGGEGKLCGRKKAKFVTFLDGVVKIFFNWQRKTYTFTAMEELKLDVHGMDYRTIANMCASMPNLMKFSLDQFQMSTKLLLALIENCKNLEFVSCFLNNDCNQKLISDIEKLKYLNIRQGSILSNNFFTALIQKRAHQLEALGVPVNSFPCHMELSIINHLEQLRYLHLTLDKWRIPIQPIILPKLELLYIYSNHNLNCFLLQTLRENQNLRLIIFNYRGGCIPSEFVEKANECLRECKFKNNRTNLPIWFLQPFSKDVEDHNARSPFIKFCYKIAEDCDPYIVKLYEEFKFL